MLAAGAQIPHFKGLVRAGWCRSAEVQCGLLRSISWETSINLRNRGTLRPQLLTLDRPANDLGRHQRRFDRRRVCGGALPLQFLHHAFGNVEIACHDLSGLRDKRDVRENPIDAALDHKEGCEKRVGRDVQVATSDLFSQAWFASKPK